MTTEKDTETIPEGFQPLIYSKPLSKLVTVTVERDYEAARWSWEVTFKGKKKPLAYIGGYYTAEQAIRGAEMWCRRAFPSTNAETELQAEVDALRDDLDDAQAKLDDLGSENEKLHTQYDHLEAASEKQSKSHEDFVARLREQLDRIHDAFEKYKLENPRNEDSAKAKSALVSALSIVLEMLSIYDRAASHNPPKDSGYPVITHSLAERARALVNEMGGYSNLARSVS